MIKRKISTTALICTLLLLLLLLTCIILILLASVPPVSRDALIHHLAIPKLYLKHGSIYQIPELVFSYYPMNLDLLYLGALYLGNDILPKYFHMAFGIATSLLLFIYFYRRLSIVYALLGSLLFISIPIIVNLSVTVYVDLGLVFFSTAALFLIFQWSHNKFKFRYIIYAGICCGLGVGTKYNGILILFLLTLFIPMYHQQLTGHDKTSTSTSIKAALLFLCFAVLAASPWLIRNTLWTGNPIFPLYDNFFSLFSSTASNETVVNRGAIQGVFAKRSMLFGETIWQTLFLPVRIFFEGKDGDPRYFDGRLNPFLLILSLFAFFQKARYSKQILLEKKILLAFCVLYFLFSINSTVLRIRYLSPIIPFLVILAMYGLRNIELFLHENIKTNIVITLSWLSPVFLMLFLNLNYIHSQFLTIDPVSYLINHTNRDDYIANYRPEYKLIKIINSIEPQPSGVLAVFLGWRGYYFDPPVQFDQHNSRDWLLAWINEPKITEQIIVKRLKDKKISHLIIRTDLFYQWLNQGDASRINLWNNLKKNFLHHLSTHLNYTLFEISANDGS